MRVLITGGGGFIGSAVIRWVIGHTPWQVLNVDKLTYAADLTTLRSVENHACYGFRQADISDHTVMQRLFAEFQPDLVMNLAAETHVDRSISDPEAFVQTNIVGTLTLLRVALEYWQKLADSAKDRFRFHQISTYEVFGDLGYGIDLVTENSAYQPSSPYSAAKAGADHLVRAWHRSYGLPTLLTNCSNNYGPFQSPDKLIPLAICNALRGMDIPVYGAGNQVRDWLHVDDLASTLVRLLRRAEPGSTYAIGGFNEKSNLDVVNGVCDALTRLSPPVNLPIDDYRELITFVQDRSGNNARHAIDARKITNDLGWHLAYSFETGLLQTVRWYLDNWAWVEPKIVPAEALEKAS